MAPPELDITREVCPMTFVRTRLALDRIGIGDMLRVRLRGEEPVSNVSRSTALLGHAVEAADPQPDGSTVLRIRKR
ncbi:sulfurtransferase TusA family protein [Rhizosaccharibacter radicis]|uniref:Sulfurtransferase TusA family protein n=1 Tax=Rhizosaccharibacter radicis TaxID=2782605 RepID=A0ABT1VZZ3_9PROT|nr:sulfurtransferase TusA family protein [Acetobacteraceae bacterium KSS12]